MSMSDRAAADEGDGDDRGRDRVSEPESASQSGSESESDVGSDSEPEPETDSRKSGGMDRGRPVAKRKASDSASPMEAATPTAAAAAAAAVSAAGAKKPRMKGWTRQTKHSATEEADAIMRDILAVPEGVEARLAEWEKLLESEKPRGRGRPKSGEVVKMKKAVRLALEARIRQYRRSLAAAETQASGEASAAVAGQVVVLAAAAAAAKSVKRTRHRARPAVPPMPPPDDEPVRAAVPAAADPPFARFGRGPPLIAAADVFSAVDAQRTAPRPPLLLPADVGAAPAVPVAAPADPDAEQPPAQVAQTRRLRVGETDLLLSPRTGCGPLQAGPVRCAALSVGASVGCLAYLGPAWIAVGTAGSFHQPGPCTHVVPPVLQLWNVQRRLLAARLVCSESGCLGGARWLPMEPVGGSGGVLALTRSLPRPAVQLVCPPDVSDLQGATLPLVSTAQLSFGSVCRAVDWMPGTARLLCGLENSTVHVVSAESDALRTDTIVLASPTTAPVTAVCAFSPYVVATATRDCFVNLWDLRDPFRSVRRTQLPLWGNALCCHDGLLLVAVENGETTLLSADDCSIVTRHASAVRGVAMSEYGMYVSGGTDGLLQLRSGGRLPRTLLALQEDAEPATLRVEQCEPPPVRRLGGVPERLQRLEGGRLRMHLAAMLTRMCSWSDAHVLRVAAGTLGGVVWTADVPHALS